jgi:hypothetical protein
MDVSIGTIGHVPVDPTAKIDDTDLSDEALDRAPGERANSREGEVFCFGRGCCGCR